MAEAYTFQKCDGEAHLFCRGPWKSSDEALLGNRTMANDASKAFWQLNRVSGLCEVECIVYGPYC